MSRSGINDADLPFKMIKIFKLHILQQVSMTVMTQANASTSSVLTQRFKRFFSDQ
ncbi:flagellin [Psychromonas sp.]|uniref:flagellin n=1 Tax=Psychromonas sp. TaxID=1884585 RepID=UPI0039E640F0